MELSSGVTAVGRGQGEECPPILLTREFLRPYREKRGKEKKGKWSRREGKSQKGRWVIENTRGKCYKWREVFFFFFFFFAFHFSKPLKFVFRLPKWKLSTGKKHFTPEKNQESDFSPSEKDSSYGSWTKAYNYSKILKTNISAKHHLSHQGSLVPLNSVLVWLNHITTSYLKTDFSGHLFVIYFFNGLSEHVAGII